jgi:hypothetical protein
VTRLGARWARLGAAGALATLALAACGGRRIESGVFYSPKGYRVTIPGPDWIVIDSSRADLEIRHRGGAAGMLVNAACADEVVRRPPARLSAQLLAAVRGRRVLERGDLALNGRPAAHLLVEGQTEEDGPAFRVETYTVNDQRCVYDLVYATPAADFAARRGDFARFIASFTTE